MTEADIERIIKSQGYMPYFNERVTSRGDGSTYNYVQLQKSATRRLVYLGAVRRLTQMSETDLVALIKTKTAKSAQKGKE